MPEDRKNKEENIPKSNPKKFQTITESRISGIPNTYSK